jgi:large subunit ribosomal protein L18
MIKRYLHKSQRRVNRVRGNVANPERTKLSIYRSNTRIYAQLVTPAGKTLASSYRKKHVSGAIEVGKEIAQKASKLGIDSIVFDRGGYKYHGQIKALADAAREGGLKF